MFFPSHKLDYTKRHATKTVHECAGGSENNTNGRFRPTLTKPMGIHTHCEHKTDDKQRYKTRYEPFYQIKPIPMSFPMKRKILPIVGKEIRKLAVVVSHNAASSFRFYCPNSLLARAVR